jgi:6-pyruvoyltetrahydropterin/6-carboxytetrahydropterin synthase
VVAAEGLAPAVEVEVECIGTPEATGYLVDITVIDRGVRDLIAPILRTALRAELGGVPSDLRLVLQACAAALAPALPAALSALTYRPSPFRSATLELGAPPTHFPEGSLPMPDAFVLTETFEFAASHRLHLAGVSADENRALFGKCNNPNGHGHNYRIEVAVEMTAEGKRRLDFGAIEGIVQREVMARFDHKHLNLDCPEFAALNPSVEHIAMVCHGLLAPRFVEAGGALRFVRVWETEKTSCRYPA